MADKNWRVGWVIKYDDGPVEGVLPEMHPNREAAENYIRELEQSEKERMSTAGDASSRRIYYFAYVTTYDSGDEK